MFTADGTLPRLEAVLNVKPGTSVYVRPEMAPPGSSNQTLRVLRSRAEDNALDLLVEGLGGRTYTLYARTPRVIGETDGVAVTRTASGEIALQIAFEGPEDAYVRRAIRLPLQ